MLHGDCFERYGRSIDAYGESFDAHRAAGAIFGYLDHPFSSRYQYGWCDEATRVGAHARLIEHIGRQPDVWWVSLSDALAFVRCRDAALVEVGSGGTLTVEFPHGEGQPPPAIHWKGRKIVD